MVNHYTYHRHYDDTSNYSSGVLAGMLLSDLATPHPPGDFDRYQYQAENDDIRRRLQELRDRQDLDAATREKVESALAAVPAPDPAPSSNGGSFWIWLVVTVAAVGGIGIGISVFAQKKTASKPVAARTSSTTKPKMTFEVNSRLKLGPTAFIIAQSAGSDIEDISGAYSISDVGSYELYGNNVTRAYFKSGACFLERTEDRTKNVQWRVFNIMEEQFPEDEEDWDFFLGSEDKPGLIGQAAFDHGTKKRHYERVWGSGNNWKKPPKVDEFLRSQYKTVHHTMMLYSRSIGNGTEYVYFEKASDATGASVKVWVGIDLTEMSIEIA